MCRRARLVAVLLLLSIPSFGEEIQLKDGTKLTGKLTGLNGDVFQIKTSYGDIQVPRSDVVSIRFPENEPPKTADNPNPAVPPVEESLAGTRYVNRTGKFQASVPPGWKLAPSLRTTADVVGALSSADETLFFLVTPEKFPGTLATYRVLAETQYKKSFTDYEKLSDSEIKVDEHNGLRLIWQAKNPAVGNAEMKAVVYILPYENRMVRLTFLTLKPLFDEALPTFERIAASYHSTAP